MWRVIGSQMVWRHVVADGHAKLQQAAADYLAGELGGRSPAELSLAGAFDEAPLEGEGRTCLYAFELAPEGIAGRPTKHYVAVGMTEPNYFPAYGLDADAAYSLHIGTRFMLETAVAIAPDADEPPAARESMHAWVAACNPDVPIEEESLAGLFRCDDQLFAVYRLRLRGQEVYCVGADCPPGFYELTEHPPLVALRLHLGQLIRAEARHDRERAAAEERLHSRDRSQ